MKEWTTPDERAAYIVSLPPLSRKLVAYSRDQSYSLRCVAVTGYDVTIPFHVVINDCDFREFCHIVTLCRPKVKAVSRPKVEAVAGKKPVTKAPDRGMIYRRSA